MLNRLVAFGVVAALTAACASSASAAPELVALRGPQDLKGWRAEQQWQWKEGLIGGKGTGAWAYTETGGADWRDYRIEATLVIEAESERRNPRWDGGPGAWIWTSYGNNAGLGGYEAGIVLRKSTEGLYRIMFSVPYQEVLLWSSRGGILQVRPFPLKEGQRYRIRAAVRGQHLTLDVDGKSVIDYRDRAAPLLSGGVALGLHEGTAYFGDVSVTSLPASTGALPPHRPDFHFRDWKGGRWAWDRGEPLFLLAKDSNGYEVKLVRGYRPQLYVFWHWLNYGAETFYASKLKEVNVIEEGQKLRFECISTDRGDKTWLTSRTEVTVTYDAGANRYVYDHVSDLIIPPGHKLRVVHPVEFTDPVMHGAVGSASTYGPQWETPHPWSVYRHVSGALYKLPHNHCSWYPGYGKPARREANGNYLAPDGGFWAMVGDPVANPVLYVLGSSVKDAKFYSELCGWAYDLHMRWIPCKYGESLGPGTYTVMWRMTSVDGQQGDRWLAEAGWCAPGDLDKKLLVYTGGVGHVERFDKVVKWASPFSEFPWGRAGNRGTEIGPSAELQDTTVGHSDSTSLRLEGPRAAGSCCGSSLYTEPFLKDTVYEISVWVKTRNVKGEGPGIVFSGQSYFPGITGTSDWQRIGFATTPTPPLHSIDFALCNSGSGTVWFDDFCIRPMKPGEAPQPPIANGPRPLPLEKTMPDRLLVWSGAGRVDDPARTILDPSGHGNHGRLEGAVAWVKEGGADVIELDGESGYVTGGHLDFKGPKTFTVWFKPPDKLPHNWNMIATGGPWNRSWFLFLFNTHPPYSIDFRPRSGRIFTKALVPQDEWSHMAVVDDGKLVRIYLNGQKVQEGEIGGNWSEGRGPLRLGTSIYYGEPKNGFTGRIAGCTYWSKALDEAKIRELFSAGPFAAKGR